MNSSKLGINQPPSFFMKLRKTPKKLGSKMAQEANFTYLIDLVNPYLPDAEDTSKEETVRLIIKQASNNQYSPMPASSTLNKYAADGISRTAAKKLLKFINKETSSLEEYFSKIGADQLTLIANKLKEDGISADVYRGKVPSLLAKLFTEEYERVASRKNNRQQKIPIQSADEDIFTKTVSDEMFAAVFRHVNVSEMDAVKNSNAIHAFVLKPELLSFNYEKLRQLVESNITNYAVARGVGKNDVMGLRAARLLRNYTQSGIPSNLLGELLNYVFLEHAEHAFKLYTRAEVYKNSRIIDNEGVYLKDNEERIQLVFGVSQLNDSLQDAIDNVIKELKDFQNNRSNELVVARDMLDTSVLETQLGDEKSKEIIKLIVPDDEEFDEIPSYGIFLGYQFKTDKDLVDCSANVAKTRCLETIKEDMNQAIKQLNQAIKSCHLQKSSFYVYMLPFTKASEDGNKIMQELIGE